ncbi:tRNA N(3)-cytidine methyltransferase METTL6-like [Styela clava]
MDAKFQISSTAIRELTPEETEKLKLQDKKLVSEFRQNELEKHAQKMWDLFYKRNGTNFFKDRHWTSREFEQLRAISSPEKKIKILEAGCGVGNFIFPLLEENSNLFIHACDFSPRAVDFVKSNPQYNTENCNAFHCDVTVENCFAEHIEENSVDMVSLIFVLSAIHPKKFLQVFNNLYKILKANGCIIFRDYAVNDYAMLRFGSGNKISENFYVRQDGTRAYYFTIELISKLAADSGFEVETNEYVLRETVNKKEGLCVPRVFLQGKFVKKDLF